MALAKEFEERSNKVTRLRTKCGYAIEQYLLECRKQSERTEMNYRGDIERYLERVFNKSIDTVTFEELECVDYDIFTQYINNEFEGLANSTINRHTSSIKALYRHLKMRNLIQSNITFLDLIALLPNDSERIMRMPIEVVEEYIEEARHEKFDAYPKQMLIKLAADTGMRLSEYLNMEWSQFHPEGNVVTITGYGKGNKRFTEKISLDFYNELLNIKKYQKMGEKKVFSMLTDRKVKGMMTRIKENLGYHDRAYSFHSLKKTAVTFAYRLTNDILEAQRKGKHTKLETTRDYLEDVDYGITGMFSLGDFDSELYNKVTHDELLEALNNMNKDMLHLLNIELNNKKKKSET